MKDVIQPDNAAEAHALQSLLREYGIAARIISYHDTAYDGLFQAQYGWGVIRVAEQDFAEAHRIIREWKESAPESLDWEKK